jgi:hypothetical protein
MKLNFTALSLSIISSLAKSTIDLPIRSCFGEIDSTNPHNSSLLAERTLLIIDLNVS